ncbi:uncharacterized protein LOC117314614 [Pecten maximus]|uniref:uncharacterized protein LOC117314614 n=1 Tax=Pecten maximus TaxID=6579 RepID=UPI001458345E|nr:uncharacterized protein LOC117314614 [Pecten maximus]
MPSNKHWCAVPECNSDGRKIGRYSFMQNVQFFPFPSGEKKPKLRKRWLDQIMRKDYEAKQHHRVCSLHFIDGKPTDDHPVPTLFGRNNYGRPKSERNTSSITKRQAAEELESDPSYEEIDCPSEIDTVFSPPFVCTVEVETDTVDLSDDHSCFISKDISDDHRYSVRQTLISDSHTSRDAAVQTDLSMFDIQDTSQKLEDLEQKLANKDTLLRDLFVDKVTRTDESVMQYTGIPSKDLLFGLFGILNRSSPTLKYWCGQGATKEMPSYQENPQKQKSGPKRKLSRFEEFILTLVKLRLALLTFFLADIFGISKSRVSQTYITWINFMFVIFTPLLKWPSYKQVKKFMPRCFKLLFPKTTCIIDCTEFFIEKPRSPSAQSLTYSSYKQRNTFKALISITPSGCINFVSNLWSGNTSDKYITRESGFLDNIKPGDEVMADRGFLIRDLLLEHHATLNIPPFTRKCSWGKGKRLNASEIKKTRNIAKLRIHVERAIERLKNFHSLSNTMPLSCKPVANQMLKVCSFLCNLQRPLVKK